MVCFFSSFSDKVGRRFSNNPVLLRIGGGEGGGVCKIRTFRTKSVWGHRKGGVRGGVGVGSFGLDQFPK